MLDPSIRRGYLERLGRPFIAVNRPVNAEQEPVQRRPEPTGFSIVRESPERSGGKELLSEKKAAALGPAQRWRDRSARSALPTAVDWIDQRYGR